MPLKSIKKQRFCQSFLFIKKVTLWKTRPSVSENELKNPTEHSRSFYVILEPRVVIYIYELILLLLVSCQIYSEEQLPTLFWIRHDVFHIFSINFSEKKSHLDKVKLRIKIHISFIIYHSLKTQSLRHF